MDILRDIPVELDEAEVIRRLRLNRRAREQEAGPLLDIAREALHPRAAYRVAFVDNSTDASVTVEGRRFDSHVLSKNLNGAQRIIPYVVTIGAELENRAGAGDVLEQYYLDSIANMAVSAARKKLGELIAARIGVPGLSTMQPGSLPDWPIEQQSPLFDLLGDVQGAIGVRLNESLLMTPRKSISGFFFATEETFFSCQLCTRPECPGRKAPYDEVLAREYGLVGEM